MCTIIREGGVGGEVEASLCYCVIVIVIVILLLCKGWDLVYYYEGWREVGGEGEASSSVFLQLASGTFQPNFFFEGSELQKVVLKCFFYPLMATFLKHTPKMYFILSLPPAGTRHVSTPFFALDARILFYVILHSK